MKVKNNEMIQRIYARKNHSLGCLLAMTTTSLSKSRFAMGGVPVVAGIKHKDKEMEGDSLLEGKCLLLWLRKMRKRRCTLR